MSIKIKAIPQMTLKSNDTSSNHMRVATPREITREALPAKIRRAAILFIFIAFWVFVHKTPKGIFHDTGFYTFIPNIAVYR